MTLIDGPSGWCLNRPSWWWIMFIPTASKFTARADSGLGFNAPDFASLL